MTQSKKILREEATEQSQYEKSPHREHEVDPLLGQILEPDVQAEQNKRPKHGEHVRVFARHRLRVVGRFLRTRHRHNCVGGAYNQTVGRWPTYTIRI
jgi:hypothetical protein